MEPQYYQQQQPYFPPPDGMMKRPHPSQYNNYRGGYNAPRGGCYGRGYNRPPYQQRGGFGGNRGRGTRNFHAPALPKEDLGPADYFMPSFLQDPWKDLMVGAGTSDDPNDPTNPKNFVMQSFFEDPWYVLLAASSLPASSSSSSAAVTSAETI